MSLNPFLANVCLLYPLKTPKNLWIFGAFWEYKVGTLARNGLNLYVSVNPFSSMLFSILQQMY